MGVDELERAICDNDNWIGDMKRAILESSTAEEVAMAVYPWFCPSQISNCISKCELCILEWLNEPYPYEEEANDDGT